MKKILKVISLLAISAAMLSVSACSSIESLCEEGNYIEAYDKANDDEKIKIKAESIAAELSARTADSLEDPSSFKLRDAYYKEFTNEDGNPDGYLVLFINGANRYGASVTDYWLYEWVSTSQEWKYTDSLSDLTDEEHSVEDGLEGVYRGVRNIERSKIKETMAEGTTLDKAAVKRINKMHEEDTLDEVEAIELTE